MSDRTDGLGRFVDINGDGDVDILDIFAIASNIGAVSPLAWPEGYVMGFSRAKSGSHPSAGLRGTKGDPYGDCRGQVSNLPCL